MEQGEVKTSRHFLLHYSDFARLRLKHLDSYIFGETVELAEIDISHFTVF